MDRRKLIAVGLGGVAIMAGGVRAQDRPDPGPIRTQIAELEATLTGIAEPGVGTPTLVEDLQFTGPAFGETFRVRPGTWAFLRQGIYDTLYDEQIDAAGKFVVVNYELTNLGDTPATYWEDSELILRDGEGRSFSRDDKATRVLTRERGLFVDDWQPNITYPALTVWDVAKSAQEFRLGVKGMNVEVVL